MVNASSLDRIQARDDNMPMRIAQVTPCRVARFQNNTMINAGKFADAWQEDQHIAWRAREDLLDAGADELFERSAIDTRQVIDGDRVEPSFANNHRAIA